MGIREAASRKVFRSLNARGNRNFLRQLKFHALSSPMESAPIIPHCTRCGIETKGRFGDVVICDDCYSLSGSCCPAFEPDHLSAAVIAATPPPNRD